MELQVLGKTENKESPEDEFALYRSEEVFFTNVVGPVLMQEVR